ncbi:PREDICTED: ubiquitin carboxyl-terminal hydrolase 35 [Ceratosolen solmsi marchali]|uniref:Ubiquitin carboxyl-terminal hydrolase 35 n=1 Tax=Ceratosolen solmsi marchali TaxID=326594 RepID=A0AAJ6VKS4_9HYME|nr:PREDICTED: ubiquitin carboxyl-terminal hydrolase 35 [Ceratosolen solmsi marchali]
MMDTIDIHLKFVECLTKIVENPNPKEVNEAWSHLENLVSHNNYNVDYKQVLKSILTEKHINNIDQIPSVLQWFSKFISPETTAGTISADIAYFLSSSAEFFEEKSYLAEILEVINDNDSIYLTKSDNSKLCQAIVEVLFWMKQTNDKQKYNEDIIKIKNFLKMIWNQNLLIDCFEVIFKIFLKNNRKKYPSSALIIVFHVVNEKSWIGDVDAVVCQLIDKISDKSKIVQMLSLFCKWINQPPDTNMKYLSSWLILFIKNLETNHNLPGLTKEIAEMALPSILIENLNLDVFYTIDTESNIVLFLMKRIGSLELLHKIMPIIYNLLSTQKGYSSYPNNPNVLTIIGITRYLHLHRFSEHLKVSCDNCSKVNELISNFNSQSYTNKILEESEEMEVCYPSTSNGFGRFNNVKVGLLNLGNTCYMNGVLQALAMTNQFCHEVLLYKNKNELNSQTVLKNLQNLFALLKYIDTNSLSPTAILYASRPSYFMPGHQQDSSEFLCHLLDVMYEQEKSSLMQSNSTDKTINTKLKVDDNEMVDTEEPIVALTSPLNNDGTSLSMYRWTTEENLSEGVSLQRKTQSLADFSQGDELVQTQNALSESHSNSTDSGIQSVGGEDSTSSSISSASVPLVGMSSSSYLVHRVFGGELKVTYQCIICNTESDNTDKFRDLQLCFLDNLAPSKEISVQDLINMNYFLPENLTGDNKYRCDKCEKLCDARRIIKILQAPAHLILTLKHFRYDSESRLRTKLRRKVFYNETIQLPVLEKSKETFRLYAAVVHSGYNMDYGHYITYACDARNRWYKFNDSYVSESSIEEFKSLEPPDTPYILFYKKCDDTLEADAPEFSVLSKNLQDYINKQNRQCLKDHRASGSKVRRHATPLYKPNNFGGKDVNDDEDDNPPPSNCRAALNVPQRPCLF